MESSFENLIKVNQYNSLEISTDPLDDVEQFGAWILEKLPIWSVQNKSIIVTVSQEASSLIPLLLNVGFTYHHAKQTTAVLTKWTGEGESRIPKFAHHYCGVAAVILDESNKLLLVKERNYEVASNKGKWKFVTGFVEPGEALAEAVKREAMEETGLEVEPEGILTFRELFPARFGVEDMCFFFVCRLGKETGLCDGELIEKEFFELSKIKWDDCTPATKYVLSLLGDKEETWKGKLMKPDQEYMNTKLFTMFNNYSVKF